MSYNVRLNRSPNERGSRLIEPTYNLAPIFDLALTGEQFPSPEVSEAMRVLFHKPVTRPRGLCVLHDVRAADSIPMIQAAIERMRDPEHYATFAALEPENKWGDVAGAISVLECMMHVAGEYPDSVWDIE